jgi:hypothetical protein
MPRRSFPLVVLGLLASSSLAVAPACSSDDSGAAAPAATSAFDPEAQLAAENAFFDFPYPSDLRLTPQGTPDLAAFPDPGVPILVGLKKVAQERKGFPVVPAAYFKFTAKLAQRDPEQLVEGGAKAPLLLVDVDPTSPERGKTYPVVAQTPNADPYVPENLLAIAGRPGVVLPPNRKLAFVVLRNVGLEAGGDASAPAMLAALARGETPSGAKGAQLRSAISTRRSGRRSTRSRCLARTLPPRPCSRPETSSPTTPRSAIWW